MVVGFTTTCAIGAYHHKICEFEPWSGWGVLDTTLCDKVLSSDLRQVGGFSSSTPVSTTNKTDRHHITEILLKVTLNTINQTIRKIWGDKFLYVYSETWLNWTSLEPTQVFRIDSVRFFKFTWLDQHSQSPNPEVFSERALSCETCIKERG